MKRIMFAGFALLLLAAQSFGDCATSVKCSLDGEYMFQEESYYNGSHKSVKYGHDYYGSEGKVHHYVIVSCD